LSSLRRAPARQRPVEDPYLIREDFLDDRECGHPKALAKRMILTVQYHRSPPAGYELVAVGRAMCPKIDTDFQVNVQNREDMLEQLQVIDGLLEAESGT